MFQLQRINKQTNTEDAQTEGQKKPENADLTGWLICATWSGDVEQAGRRLEFDLAYTTRDKSWQNPELELGDEVLFIHIDDKTQQTFHLFQGRIFGRSRESGSSVMHFTAFDNIVYLAKSRITKKYTNVTVADAIRQTINDFSIPAGTMPDLSVICNLLPMISRLRRLSSRHYPISLHRMARDTIST